METTSCNENKLYATKASKDPKQQTQPVTTSVALVSSSFLFLAKQKTAEPVWPKNAFLTGGAFQWAHGALAEVEGALPSGDFGA